MVNANDYSPHYIDHFRVESALSEAS